MTSDFWRLDAILTDEERSIRDTVRGWVREKYMPKVTSAYLGHTFPRELIPELAELGVFGIKTNPTYGGLGADSLIYGLTCRELEWADSGLRSFVSVQNSLVMYPIERYGTEAQKKHWLPLLATGKAIGAFGLTEPESGSDPAGMCTRVTKSSSGTYRLCGSKQWITNGTLADVIVVWARNPEGAVQGHLVEKGMPGFHAEPIIGKLSLCASHTATLFFDDVEIDEAHILPGAKGIGKALACLNEARFGIAWGAAGSARFCYDTAVEYVSGRKSFGAPIAAKQLVQERLVQMRQMVEDSHLRAHHLAHLHSRKQITPEHISHAKRANVRDALETARMARALMGANGITADYHVIRHAANLETVMTYEGTEEIHTLIEGAEITGIKAF